MSDALSIDMNIAFPEIAAARHFWPMLSPGGVILLDDNNWTPHINQKRAFDELASADPGLAHGPGRHHQTAGLIK